MRAFGRPKGMLGKLGGIILARTKHEFTAWFIELLDIQPHDKVLEVGFGPGVSIERLATLASEGYVAGADASAVMVKQATARNAEAIKDGRVDLRHGSVECLPFDDDAFDKACAINSMQVWTDATAGLREMRRVLKTGGTIALGFDPNSRQPSSGLPALLTEAGFVQARVIESHLGFCALAVRS